MKHAVALTYAQAGEMVGLPCGVSARAVNTSRNLAGAPLARAKDTGRTVTHGISSSLMV